MSYILDALKKNQLEQEGDFSGISTFRRQPRRLPTWLVVVLIAALLINCLLLTWIFLIQPQLDSSAGNTDAGQPQPATSQGKAPLTAEPSATTNLPASNQAQQRRVESPVVPPPTPQPAPPSPVDTAPPAPVAAAPAPVPAPASRVVNQPPPVTPLRELSETEQTIYNGFNYTSHIFTDEPSECAIVIDGQRLQAGDGFKGLQVVRITEAGVVFAENRRGQKRHVEVSVIEQWDKQ